jgi:hypothetical protein
MIQNTNTLRKQLKNAKNNYEKYIDERDEKERRLRWLFEQNDPMDIIDVHRRIEWLDDKIDYYETMIIHLKTKIAEREQRG